MSIFVMAAAALVAGADWRVVSVGVVAMVAPWSLLVLAGGVAIHGALTGRNRIGPPAAAEGALHTAMASELRGGASLRGALSSAAADAPGIDLRRAVRYAAAGADIAKVAEALEECLPVTGVSAAAAIQLSAGSGARAASAFDALADRAAFEASVAREHRALTAQARLSALVVGGGPLVVAAVLLVTGRARVLIDHGAVGITAGLVGLGLELAGVAVVIALLRRHA